MLVPSQAKCQKNTALSGLDKDMMSAILFFAQLSVNAQKETPDCIDSWSLLLNGSRANRLDFSRQVPVPSSHDRQMSPLSTPWGYALPRVFIEQAGRREQRTWKRYSKAIDFLEKAIQKSETPIELLAIFSELAIKTDADPVLILGHIFAPGIVLEENCRTMYNQIAEMLRRRAPKLWAYYVLL